MALSKEIFYVFRKDGSKIRIGGTDANPEYLCVRELQLEDTFLGQKQVTVSFKSPFPLDFQGQEYIILDDDKYTLKYTPSAKKQARSKEYGEAFVYDNVILQSLTDETTRVEFRDYVLEDNGIHYSSMNTVYFYGTVKDLAMRIQANLDRVYTGDEKWTVTLGEDLPTTEKQKTYDKVTVWDAVTDIWEEYKVLFYTVGRTLYVGCGSSTVPHDFMYGIGKGLKSLEKKADENNQIITRLHAYGSDKNLPYRYYNTVGQMVTANLEVSLVFIALNQTLETTNTKWSCDIYFYVKDAPTSMFKASGNKFSLTGTHNLDGVSTTKTLIFDADVSTAPSNAYDPTNNYTNVSYISCLHTSLTTYEEYRWLYWFTYQDKVKTATFLSYTNVNINYVPTSWIDEETSLISQSMYLPNLLLPAIREKGNVTKYYDADFKEITDATQAVYKMAKTGFGGKDLDIYLESVKGIEQFGVLEGTVIFDNNTDTDFVDLVDDENGIYPTLSVATDGTNEVVSATQLTDAGVFDKDGNVSPTTFEVVVKPGFNPALYIISGETAQISFKSGALIGRTFDFDCSDNKDGTYTLTCNRVNDDSIGLAFPNSSYNVQKGDKFVFVGIELPDEYIQKAEIRVLNAGLAYLANYDHTKYLYTPELDNIFLARTENKEIRDGLKAGANFRFTDADINRISDNEAVTIKLPISKLTMKIGSSMIREYEITLADTPDIDSDIVSRTIKAVSNSFASSGGGGLNEGDVKIIGDKRYLSKVSNDTAAGMITFLQQLRANKGVQFGSSFAEGMTGYGGRIDGNGDAWLDSLSVRHFLEVPELRYNKATVILGDQWHSPGGGTVESCEPDTDADGNTLATGTITLKLEDGEIGAVAVDDICMGYFHFEGGGNATETTDDSKGNRTMAGFTTVYFRVTEIMDTTGMNKTFRYALRPVSDTWTTQAHPQEALEFTVYGNFTDKDRQKSCYSTRTYTRYLANVDNWEFEKHNIMMQLGDLSNLSAFEYGVDMTGYSAYLNNIYMSGTIQQFEQADYYLELDTSGYTDLAWGETMHVTCTLKQEWHGDKTSEVTAWKVTRDSGDTDADTIWNAAHTDFAGEIDIHYNDEANDLRRTDGVSTIFTFTATHGGETEDATLTV